MEAHVQLSVTSSKLSVFREKSERPAISDQETRKVGSKTEEPILTNRGWGTLKFICAKALLRSSEIGVREEAVIEAGSCRADTNGGVAFGEPVSEFVAEAGLELN